jgi:hypothetical protein
MIGEADETKRCKVLFLTISLPFVRKRTMNVHMHSY